MRPESPVTHRSDSLSAAARTPPQGRKRPLRTYSRRSIQSKQQQEGLPARDEGRAVATPDPACPQPMSPTQQLPSPNLVETKKPSRGSILAYFQPLPPSSDTAPPEAASSDPAEPASTPRSSPPPLMKPRKRRRLTTRPQFSGPDEEPTKSVGDGARNETRTGNDSTAEVATLSPCNSMIDNTTIVVRMDAPDAARPALSEVAFNPLQGGPSGALADRSMKNKQLLEKRTAKDLMQTTLSLSVQKEPGFTICSVCDILYNPLNEKDRREHSRRHAAFSRSRKRTSPW
ncbi:hypothetical protein VTI74DRAFT_403 [Chaetomium olivicolor]